ncbi:MAG: fumarylacetoacetate hydrolase family protein [Candidatus Bathyarchaeia archaeon]
MKLVTFRVHTECRLGALIKEGIVDLNSAYKVYLKERGELFPNHLASGLIPPDMRGFLEGGEKSKKEAERVLKWVIKKKNLVGIDGEKLILGEEARIQAPISYPGKIYCTAVNYYDHATERLAKEPEIRKKEIARLKNLNLKVADCFQKQPSLIIGTGVPIIKPKVSQQLDYENELAIVIGKKCKDVKPEDAYSCIAGYTILIDMSFRDQGFPQDVDFRLYKGDINWTKGKGMDNAAPMGPCIVTADEIPDPYKVPLKLLTRVNNKTRQNGTVEDMIIKIPDLVSYLSRGTTLNPGDIIATGTCAGVATSWGPEGYLNIGDVLECEIQPIGVMKHTVVEDKGPI